MFDRVLNTLVVILDDFLPVLMMSERLSQQTSTTPSLTTLTSKSNFLYHMSINSITHFWIILSCILYYAFWDNTMYQLVKAWPTKPPFHTPNSLDIHIPDELFYGKTSCLEFVLYWKNKTHCRLFLYFMYLENIETLVSLIKQLKERLMQISVRYKLFRFLWKQPKKYFKIRKSVVFLCFIGGIKDTSDMKWVKFKRHLISKNLTL